MCAWLTGSKAEQLYIEIRLSEYTAGKIVLYWISGQIIVNRITGMITVHCISGMITVHHCITGFVHCLLALGKLGRSLFAGYLDRSLFTGS